MKRLGKLLAWIVVGLAVVFAVGITLTIGWRPFIGPHAQRIREGAKAQPDQIDPAIGGRFLKAMKDEDAN